MERGQSNWLLSFRESLKKSKETQGFVFQIQAGMFRDKSDMQKAEEDMAKEIEKTGVPRIGCAESGQLGMPLELRAMQYVLMAKQRAEGQWSRGRIEDSVAIIDEGKYGTD